MLSSLVTNYLRARCAFCSWRRAVKLSNGIRIAPPAAITHRVVCDLRIPPFQLQRSGAPAGCPEWSQATRRASGFLLHVSRSRLLCRLFCPRLATPGCRSALPLAQCAFLWRHYWISFGFECESPVDHPHRTYLQQKPTVHRRLTICMCYPPSSWLIKSADNSILRLWRRRGAPIGLEVASNTP